MSGFTFRPSNARLCELAGFTLLALSVALILSLVSYYPLDPSADVVGAADRAQNLIGVPGAWFSDVMLQWLGLAAFLFPTYLVAVGWALLRPMPARSRAAADGLRVPPARLAGGVLLLVTACWALGFDRDWQLWSGVVQAGGVIGTILADLSLRWLNPAGTVILLGMMALASLYLLTSFELAQATEVASRMPRPERWKADWPSSLALRWGRWRAAREGRPEEAADEIEGRRASRPTLPDPLGAHARADLQASNATDSPPIVPYAEGPAEVPELAVEPQAELEFEAAAPAIARRADEEIERMGDEAPPWAEDESSEDEEYDGQADEPEIDYRVPTTSLLAPPHERSVYDPDELHLTARRIQEKFEEFKVGGTVVQINPGPVVTTFEFKPSPGIKYSKILNLSEDLCLGLECESILVERIPGKSTIGIEVPNRKREVITLREVVESREFRESDSPLTVAMGKDIAGRLNVADLTTMPHLLVAGSTGSGKSVMINAFIMSILLRATPDQVRFIMVDPKTVELGLYHDIPHLLTPVITDMKKASNAMKNATAEMERRLKLLAEHSVRNIDQFNVKVDRLKAKYEFENPDLAKSLRKLPYIVIIIDELADLMMLEGRQIEESITRLAQMARAVGIHLVLATQRPSVDVITGLIKANVPARISFRLATRVDSRTILDSMGAEALLGRGDMLFLPPGTARMTRLHGPFVTEEEIDKVVREWKLQGKPRYENVYLAAPPEEADSGEGDAPGLDDPVYEEAVRTVLEMGKASTSTLQRRLRLGYGRAARILDAMEKDGIISPPDGSRPREVLKAPDWLAEVETTQL